MKQYLKPFPLLRETYIKTQETQSTTRGLNQTINFPRHAIDKLSKIKDKYRILKTIREKHQLTYSGTSITLTEDS